MAHDPWDPHPRAGPASPGPVEVWQAPAVGGAWGAGVLCRGRLPHSPRAPEPRRLLLQALVLFLQPGHLISCKRRCSVKGAAGGSSRPGEVSVPVLPQAPLNARCLRGAAVKTVPATGHGAWQDSRGLSLGCRVIGRDRQDSVVGRRESRLWDGRDTPSQAADMRGASRGHPSANGGVGRPPNSSSAFSPFPETPCQASRPWGHGPHGRGRRGAGLTEDKDVPQALDQGALELRLFLPGQLLGDRAAVTQAGPQPVGRQEAALRGRPRPAGGLGPPRPCPRPSRTVFHGSRAPSPPHRVWEGALKMQFT